MVRTLLSAARRGADRLPWLSDLAIVAAGVLGLAGVSLVRLF